MSEAEVHVLQARLNDVFRNKARRGELRCGLPVSFVGGDADGEVRFHPDIAAAIRNVLRTYRWGRRIAFGSRCGCTPVPRPVGASPATPPSTKS